MSYKNKYRSVMINSRRSNNQIAMIMLLAILFSFYSCKKLVEVDAPITSINANNVYADDATAAAVLTGIYTNMSRVSITGPGITPLTFYAGLSADEFNLNVLSNITYRSYYTNSLAASPTSTVDFWINIYKIIYVANDAIEGLTKSEKLTSAIKQQLLGEAKFMRAFCYFYLVNVYGDVPLALTTDYTINSALARTSKANVFQQIVADLKDAQSLLSNNYVSSDAITPTNERVRPTKWAATALLARVYLYTAEYTNAEDQASAIINNTSMYGLTTLPNTFLKNSNEVIWQLQPVFLNRNAQDASTFILTGAPNETRPLSLRGSLINSFEINDARKSNWVGSITVGAITYYYPNKYKKNIVPTTTPTTPPSEYSVVLRIAEQYLIRAEARAHLNKITESQSDINAIRSRANLPNSTANDKTSLLSVVLHERQVELFSEWGHRWFDLKRTGTVDAVMSTVTSQKGGSWNSNWQWYPIPVSEIQKNSALVQNIGY